MQAKGCFFIKDLLDTLQNNGKDTSGLTALIDHVNGMESFCKQAENKIEDMKCQLAEMKEIQSHPIRSALQNTTNSLKTKVAEIREQLSVLKANIIDGCKNAVAAFKANGIIALDKLASFFRVKTCLKKVKNSAVKTALDCNKALDKIEAFSQEYHKAGRGLKNMARIAVGKMPIDKVKKSGKLAKTFGAPYRAYKTCMYKLYSSAVVGIEKIDTLSRTADAKREEKAAAKKPSLEERLNEKKEFVRQKEHERVVPERGLRTSEVAI